MLHAGLGLKYRTWFFSGMMLMGGLGELIGYIGRVGSAYDVLLNNYFLVQIVCLIIAPAFFSAALYVTIGKLYLPNDITDSLQCGHRWSSKFIFQADVLCHHVFHI